MVFNEMISQKKFEYVFYIMSNLHWNVSLNQYFTDLSAGKNYSYWEKKMGIIKNQTIISV